MGTEKVLSVVMPVYNERETVPRIIAKVLALHFVKEVIVVDDGSTDGTRELLRESAFDSRVRVFFHEKNRGKGAALRTGFGHATGEIVTVQDADLEYDPEEFAELIKPIREGVADVVYGSRLSGGKPQRVHLFWHKLGNNFLTFLTNLLYNTTLTDMETCYKMFRREVIETIRIASDDFSVEPELTAKIFKNKRWRVYELPISYYGRSYAEGKKITWKHGFSALWTLLKYRFTD
ncbi:MAG: glycosyltransferase family 2 protein [Proteobacteria bacterium]|nr:glycosyltransferase family 2 protein [Pseudomonadota bacterium]MBU2228335.1 glycosyltransferase family 2 protein [Pseudomonadota bacterium]MBU2262330.1 glycosyltransferase family 2 protein [Pseudomonadota bacterium]